MRNDPTERATINTLTGMQRKFFEAYAANGMKNATEAARIAGYKHPNQSGPALLKKPKIQAAINDVLRAQVMSRDEVLRRLSSQARGEFADFVHPVEQREIDPETGEILTHDERNANGRLYFGPVYIDIKAMLEAGKGHLIQKLSINRYGPDVDFTSTQNALIHIGRHYKLFTDAVEQKNAIPEEIAALLDDINGCFPVDV